MISGEPEGRVLVLGVGNLLLGDEGVGVHVARRLAALPLPAGVEVVDGGTLGFELARLFEGRRTVILIDAIEADAPPGSVFRLSPEEASLRAGRPGSAHGEGIDLLLRFVEGSHPRCRTVIVGIVPERTDRVGTGLSEGLANRMDTFIEAALREIHRALPALLPEAAA